MNQTSFHCPQCQQMKLFQQPQMNHTPHILASVFLCGLWLPVWALISATYNPPWRCSFCGYSDATEYLANPRLKQERMAEAQQRARIAKQTRIDRAGSTFQERAAYFVSDYQGWLIGFGIVAGLIGLGGIITIFVAPQKQSQLPQPTSPATNSQLEQSEINLRNAYARTLQEKYQKLFRGTVVSASGPKYQTIFITSPRIRKKFVDEFRQSETIKELKQNGFTDARIEGAGKEEWRIWF